jgi:hypothetical protein
LKRGAGAGWHLPPSPPPFPAPSSNWHPGVCGGEWGGGQRGTAPHVGPAQNPNHALFSVLGPANLSIRLLPGSRGAARPPAEVGFGADGSHLRSHHGPSDRRLSGASAARGLWQPPPSFRGVERPQGCPSDFGDRASRAVLARPRAKKPLNGAFAPWRGRDGYRRANDADGHGVGKVGVPRTCRSSPGRFEGDVRVLAGCWGPRDAAGALLGGACRPCPACPTRPAPMLGPEHLPAAGEACC